MQEQWRPVLGYEGLYEISDHGRVKSLARLRHGRTPQRKPAEKYHAEAIKKQSLHPKGYLYVGLAKSAFVKKKFVHRLVAEAFIDNPQKLPQINHKSGDKSDNRSVNLEWCTAAHNIQHAYDLSLNFGRAGEACPTAKLTAENVRFIRAAKASGQRAVDIAHATGVSTSNVYKILSGFSWGHI